MDPVVIDLTGDDSPIAINNTNEDINNDKALGQTISEAILNEDVNTLREIVTRYPRLNLSRFPGDWEEIGWYTPIGLSIINHRPGVFDYLTTEYPSREHLNLEEILSLGMQHGEMRRGTALGLCARHIQRHRLHAIAYASKLLEFGAQVHAEVISTEQPLAVLLQSVDKITDRRLFEEAINLASLFVSALRANNKINTLSRNGAGYIHNEHMHPRVLRLLLEAGADMYLWNEEDSQYPLEDLLYTRHAPENLTLLFERGCEPNQHAFHKLINLARMYRNYDPTWERTMQVLFDYNMNVDFLVGEGANFFASLNSLSALRKAKVYRLMPIIIWNLLARGFHPVFLEQVDLNLLPETEMTQRIFQFLENDRISRTAAVLLGTKPLSTSYFRRLNDDNLRMILGHATPEYARR